MFVPMPMSAPVVVRPEHFYNKYEKLDDALPQHQFVASEGTYRATDDINLAFPASHPSEPLPNPNPLTPYAAPWSNGLKLKLVRKSNTKENGSSPFPVTLPVVRTLSQGDMPIMDKLTMDENGQQTNGHAIHDDAASSNGDTNGDALTHSVTTQSSHAQAGLDQTPPTLSSSFDMIGSPMDRINSQAVSLGGSSVFDAAYGSGKRKKRTGTSANGTTSTYVSRAVTDPALNTRLLEPNREDVLVLGNMTRCISMFDIGAKATMKHEPLSKLLFSLAQITCHDINAVTKTQRSMDVVIGTSTGDICWYDPVSTKYLRFNKQRCIAPGAVTAIQWLPGSESLFMATHANGLLVVYDKDREDVDFYAQLVADNMNVGEDPDRNPAFPIYKSCNDLKAPKTNPVSSFGVSRQACTAFAISPDQTHVAVTCDDGCLKVINFRDEKLLDVYSSYYGGLTCVAWSPDGQYIVTGGKDDTVTIWSFLESCIVARCQGHSSFITAVAFDQWKCDQYSYRIGSVADDGNLLLWDFAIASLHKPSNKAAKNQALQMPDEAHRPLITTSHDHKSRTKVAHGTVFHLVSFLETWFWGAHVRRKIESARHLSVGSNQCALLRTNWPQKARTMLTSI
ncbi:WD40-repeat-containing domain protein [Protomyces lactucae-debilis]|uniref:WD40-repeat-containing domain protein n=1 Tax=Protomyces lactucae-debilis TaxID=2754530 RepID=A0A1Y2FCW6_PROLT|nr:WD40-repeat-containing domain protein [Protomyces lactucae-debilis]ORY81457.1 WD40-repeat-containing domain protein [Protomyces lactucae-debilis]